MPQMMPLNWIILMFFFYILFYIIFSQLFFNSPLININSKIIKLSSSNLNWLW
uniref:ATP synthase F0 subunit 8 n=1 Tax=Cheumatopsyche charites TaxID=1875285 RepID=UPI0022DCE0EA|nr:ATP synthase F0 subunit 8 [Cheumatopsyche charites]UZZ43834.1 ATP synthase F0 subunit 8 [Cheumatopsyche charites]